MVSSSTVIELIILQISVAFSPGLIIALIVNESVQKSRKNGLQVAGGAATVSYTHLTLPTICSV